MNRTATATAQQIHVVLLLLLMRLGESSEESASRNLRHQLQTADPCPSSMNSVGLT